MNARNRHQGQDDDASQARDDATHGNNTFGEIAQLDKLIHEPARLALLTALSASESADFTYLQRVTALSKGNLSAHLATLEAAGVIEVKKGYSGRRPKTWVRLTPNGRTAITDYWETMARWHSSLARANTES